MTRLRTRLQTTGMALDITVFSGMLASSLLAGDKIDRMRGLVEPGWNCVDTPGKMIVDVSIRYQNASKVEQMLS